LGGGVVGGFGPDLAPAARPCCWIVVFVGLVIAALGYVTTTSWARGTARRTAARLDG